MKAKQNLARRVTADNSDATGNHRGHSLRENWGHFRFAYKWLVISVGW